MSMVRISFLIIILLTHAVQAAVFFLSTKVGDQLVLDLGKEVHQWHRVRDGRRDSIWACGFEKEVCSKWVDEKSVPVGDGREKLFPNGTLVIDPFQASDAGDYFSDDEPQRIIHNLDGTYAMLARTKISVITI